MAWCRVSTTALLSWILYTQVATAVPAKSNIESADSFSTPGVEFYIYSNVKAVGTPLTGDLEGIIPSYPLTLVMHGFKGDRSAKSMRAIKEALLLTGVENVVLVDWAYLANSPDKSALAAYSHVRDVGVPEAGALVARWLRRVLILKKIPPEKVHLIGFSLGAHLAAIVGRLLNSTVGRITGLDPPKFGYAAVPVERRLTSTAAQFVDVIHTTGGVLGYPEAIGHVDFFPNGDSLPQPGCPADNAINIITCSHYMSFMLFSESILNEHSFMATECESWLSLIANICKQKPKVPMGYSTPNTTRGTFFIKTNEKIPYGEEDSSHPVPDEMRSLLSYNESDSLIDPVDVVSFFTNKGSQEEQSGVDNTLAEETNSKVMRVKSARPSFSGTSTTEPPPAFLNSSSYPRVVSLVLIVFFTGFNLRHSLSVGFNCL